MKRDERLAQRQTCKVCRMADHFDFHVPDEVWAAVVPERFRAGVVCLTCFDDFAAEKGVIYADCLRTLYFAGDRAAFEFRVVAAANVER